MKVKLKRQKKDTAKNLGSPAWDGTVRINDQKFVPSKEYDVEEDFYERNKNIFTTIKDKNDE